MMKYTDVNDDVLLDLLSSGDEEAFKIIYLRHWNTLINVAIKRLPDEQIVSEIVQDIFVDLWTKRLELKIDNLGRYLYSSAKYKIIDYYRASLTRQKYAENQILIPRYAGTFVEEQLDLEDLEMAVERGLDQLPAKTSKIFRLNRLEDQSVREISVHLQIPERTVEYHITKSLKLLREHLSEYSIHAYFSSILLLTN